MKRNFWRKWFFLTMTLLVSCASDRASQVSTGGSSKDSSSAPSVRSGDILAIQVKGEKDCTGTFAVGADGAIEFCYAGRVVVAGKTAEAIEGMLEQALAKDYLKHPKVVVDFSQSPTDKGDRGWTADSIRILGQVGRPGIFPWKRGYTCLDAILEAGGITEFAAANRTRIVRGEGDRKEEIVVKLKDVMKSGDREQDVLLRPGDTIIVPESYF